MNNASARNGMQTNIEEVFEQFSQLTQKEMTSAVKKALRTAANALRKETVSNLKSAVMNPGLSKGKYSDKIYDAPRIIKFRNNRDEELESGVHIMGSRDPNSGTFRARFLEKGTVDRYQKTFNGQTLKKARYTGKITPKWFFKSANNAIFGQLDQIYMSAIEEAVNKINNTKL